jgi:hypothetical protein
MTSNSILRVFNAAAMLILMGVIAQRNASANLITDNVTLTLAPNQNLTFPEGPNGTLTFVITNSGDKSILTPTAEAVSFGGPCALSDRPSCDPDDKPSYTPGANGDSIDMTSCVTIAAFATGKPATSCTFTVTFNTDVGPPETEDPVDSGHQLMLVSVNLKDGNRNTGIISDTNNQGMATVLVTVQDVAAPEPATLSLVAAGGLLIAVGRLRSRKKTPLRPAT